LFFFCRLFSACSAINNSKEAENQVLQNSSHRLSEQMSSENLNTASTISIASSSLNQIGNKKSSVVAGNSSND
jgi:hypothetical protein